MPALVRGGSQRTAKPRPKASSAVRTGRARAPKRPAAASPAKLRAVTRIGLKPGLAVAAAGGIVALGLVLAFSAGGRWRATTGAVAAAVDKRLGALGFRVADIQLQGASPMARADILKASQLRLNDPILGVDLSAMRGRIEQVGWVKTVKVVRLLPDTLVIAVAERRPAAVWQHHGRTLVVDETGQGIPEADPVRFTDLPLVVGEGANQNAGEILSLVRARPRLLARLEALVRVDDRRWDVRLKDGGLIQLPATGEDSALIQLDQLDQKARILELGFARIDLRDPDMVGVRPKVGAAPAPAVVAGA